MRTRARWPWQSGSAAGAAPAPPAVVLYADYDFSLLPVQTGLATLPNTSGDGPDLANVESGKAADVVLHDGLTWGSFDGSFVGCQYRAAMPDAAWSVPAGLPSRAWTSYVVIEPVVSGAASGTYVLALSAAPSEPVVAPNDFAYFQSIIWGGGGGFPAAGYTIACENYADDGSVSAPGTRYVFCMRWARNGALSSISWGGGPFVWNHVTLGPFFPWPTCDFSWLCLGQGYAGAPEQAPWFNSGFNGLVGEWQLYQGAHSDAQAQAVMTALGAKWGF